MMYLVMDVQSTEHIEKCSLLNAWVNVASQSEALGILSDELSLQGWAVTNIIEATPTVVSDYFSPCTSLDAFNEARENLMALRFS
ncbi:hypothetical protein MNBD_GAMMA11-1590 [hydrothermal vent metagenome]|uniref:Uncharacterized protein n=1 Tax=hydrothermal vent metagenome TaxID=652676 RepID=A0A3B0XKQ7_9ZZZZ